MIARWEQGRAVVDRLIAEERIQRVDPSRELADLMGPWAHRRENER